MFSLSLILRVINKRIPSRKWKTKLPILSVRKMAKRNNEVKFKKDGGFIRNRKAGRLLKFQKHEGAYFLKLEVLDPSSVNMFSNGNGQVLVGREAEHSTR